MRGKRNHSAIVALAGTQPVAASGTVTRMLAETVPRILSCRLWRTGPAWDIPRRTIADTMLFLPLRGRLTVAMRRRVWDLDPQRILVIPDQEPHAVAYAPGDHALEVLAVHLHLDWPDGSPVAAGFTAATGPLPEAGRWHQDLTRLAAVLEDDPELGALYGRPLLHRLFAELLLSGWGYRRPEGPRDPRLVAAVARMRAEPGAGLAIADLAAQAGISAVRFRQLFRQELGVPPKVFLDRLRLAEAARLLGEGMPVAETARRTGFAAPRQLQARFRAAYGTTPARWRREGDAI